MRCPGRSQAPRIESEAYQAAVSPKAACPQAAPMRRLRQQRCRAQPVVPACPDFLSTRPPSLLALPAAIGAAGPLRAECPGCESLWNTPPAWCPTAAP
eukprot:scaffold10028_cov236-Isochrysis_galbana.AAC.4